MSGCATEALDDVEWTVRIANSAALVLYQGRLGAQLVDEQKPAGTAPPETDQESSA